MDLKAMIRSSRRPAGFFSTPPDKHTEMQETGWADLLRYELRTAGSYLLRTKDPRMTVDLLK